MPNDARQQTRRALQECHRLRHEGHVAGLIAQLQSHDDLDVRLCAARGLGGLNDKRAAPALAQAATTDSDPRVREAALRALAKVDRHAAVPALIDQFDTKVRRVRRTAASLLSDSDSPETAGVLTAALCDSDWYVRCMAAAGL